MVFPGPSESYSDVWKVFTSCTEILLAWTQWQMVASGFHQLLLEEPGQSSEEGLALRLFKVRFLKGSWTQSNQAFIECFRVYFLSDLHSILWRGLPPFGQTPLSSGNMSAFPGLLRCSHLIILTDFLSREILASF